MSSRPHQKETKYYIIRIADGQKEPVFLKRGPRGEVVQTNNVRLAEVFNSINTAERFIMENSSQIAYKWPEKQANIMKASIYITGDDIPEVSYKSQITMVKET